MSGTESEIDAIFYRLIHQLSRSPQTPGDTQRRAQNRKPFRIRQRIASWEGQRCPDESAFFEVQCHDLTQGGFSFLLPSVPSFGRLVAEFGTPPDLIYVAAQVLHFSRVLVHPNGLVDHLEKQRADPDGAADCAVRCGKSEAPSLLGQPEAPTAAAHPVEPQFLVGCRFMRRLPRPLWADYVKR